jgi:transposase
MATNAPNRPQTPPEPALKTAPDTTRDQRLQIQTLRDAGFIYNQIREQIDVTLNQIQYALQHRITPQKRSGRPPFLAPEEVAEIIEWICASKVNRRAPWSRIPILLELSVSYYCVRTALRNAGFSRRVARRKPPISERNRVKRLEWAVEHADWTIEQWKRILWSDETWVNGDRHTKTYVTRRTGEEWDPTCIVEKHQRRKGWMFWGSFHDTTKGPGIFWEKDWGTIREESYRAKIVPLIDDYLRLHAQNNNGVRLTFMQDSAPAHAAIGTVADLRERGIVCVKWPAYSPDLNPIEKLWNWIKD